MSQVSRIVVLLRERPHTCAEILREVPCIVHSRVSDLRAQGFVIEHQTTGPGAAGSLYTLLSEPDRTAVAWPGDSSGSLSGEESKPINRPTGMSSRAKDAESPASRPQDGAAPFSGAHPAPTVAQLMSPPPDNAGPASPSSPEGCSQNESAQQLSLLNGRLSSGEPGGTSSSDPLRASEDGTGAVTPVPPVSPDPYVREAAA